MRPIDLKLSESAASKTILFLLTLLISAQVNAQIFKVLAVSDMNRVFEDRYNLPVMHDTLNIFGIGGEIISGQCAILAKKELRDVTVVLSAFSDKITGRSLPSGSIEWNFVGSVVLSENTPNQPARELERKAPARFPDYLMAERLINVAPKTYKAVYLTLSIPENTAAGTYSGSVTVKCLQGEQALPVNIDVYPVNLPVTRNLKVTEWYNTSRFSDFHGIEERYSDAWFAMLAKYADNMAAHRQNVFQVPMSAIDIKMEEDGKLNFDFSRFDQIARVFWNTGKMNFLETGELVRFGSDAWFSTDLKLQDFRVNDLRTGQNVNLPGKDVIPFLLPAFESHLRQQGWLDKTLFHIKDEPSMHNSVPWREMSAYIHHYAPDLKRIDAIETTNILNDIEVAVPKLDAFGTWYDSYRNAQEKGVELWFYTVGIYQGSLFPNKTIDLPVMNSRILHWLNYRYDATGFLHWGWNQWEDDPFNEVGMHIGDGWHVYPARDGVLNSLRWEQMRNGIQDYECFLLLEGQIASLKDSLGRRAEWIKPKQRGKEIASKVVKSIEEHSDDPEVLYAAKMELIHEIMQFNESPRIYIQTTPMEGSTLTYHSSVEVYGWTESGTKISVNGKELPVNDQGYFFEQFGGDSLDTTKFNLSEGTIRVQATKDGRSREIIRRFNIKH